MRVVLGVSGSLPGVSAGWGWNSTDDISASTIAITKGGSPSGPWDLGLRITRSAFEIDGPADIPPATTLKR